MRIKNNFPWWAIAFKFENSTERINCDYLTENDIGKIAIQVDECQNYVLLQNYEWKPITFEK